MVAEVPFDHHCPCVNSIDFRNILQESCGKSLTRDKGLLGCCNPTHKLGDIDADLDCIS